MKKLIKILLATILILIAIYYGGGYYFMCKSSSRDIKMGYSMCMDYMNQFPIKYLK